MSTVYIFKYNNYTNRRLKKEDALTEYPDPIYTESATNFNPSDGISARYVAGKQANPYLGGGDYLIYSEDNTSITSRWFITEQTRNLYGQFVLNLRRDIVAEHWNDILQVPFFVEKATLKDSDPLIYNRENITVNQIKQGPDYLIKDELKMPWVVGYFVPGKEMTAIAPLDKYDLIVNGIENLQFYEYTTKAFKRPNGRYLFRIGAQGKYKQRTSSSNYSNRAISFVIGRSSSDRTTEILTDWNKYDGQFKQFETNGFPVFADNTSSNVVEQVWDYSNLIYSKVKDKYMALESAAAVLLDVRSQDEYNSFINYIGKIIYDSNSGKYYKYSIKQIQSDNKWVSAPGYINSTFNSAIQDINGLSGTLDANEVICIYTGETSYNVVLTEIGGKKLNITIPAEAPLLNDSPYSIFAMPYGALDVYKNGSKIVTTTQDVGLKLGTELFRKYGAGDGKVLYDLQLVPFNPIRGALDLNGLFDVTNQTFYNITDDNGDTQGVCCIAKSATFSFEHKKIIPIDNIKIENETEVYRIVSPDYSSQFDFSIAKNNGLEGFIVDVTYRPFTPYIQVQPKFRGLYGDNWQDGRGLICGFSFSLPVLSNAWESHQLSQVNFQKIFDRETQYIEVKNKYANAQQATNSIVNALGVGVGAGLIGGPIAGIGAGLASAAGGIADYAITKKLQGEALDYRSDMFALQLGNVQALPNALAKIGAFVANNKIYPYLEHYTCTDEEKNAVANKIAWNGMTVGAIGKIADYLGNTWSCGPITDKGYIKGLLIRYDGCNDAHELAVLQNELNEGIYTK